MWLRHLAEGITPWAVPVFCIGEFIRVVTHRRIFRLPSTLEQALGALDGLGQSPSIRILYPSETYYPLLKHAVLEGRTTGNIVFDAQIAAVCREHGVGRILTEDRDFARFAALEIVSLDADPSSYAV